MNHNWQRRRRHWPTARPPPDERAPLDFDDTEADLAAKRCYDSAVFSWLFFPMIGLAIYYFFKAVHQEEAQPPADPRRFCRRLVLAGVIGLLPFLLTGILISWSLAAQVVGPALSGELFKFK